MITTDDFPEKTTWKIFDNENNEIFFGGPYDVYDTFEFEKCISEGSFFSGGPYDVYDTFEFEKCISEGSLKFVR